MAFVANLFKDIAKSIPILLAKVGTILLFIFTFGLFSGYIIAAVGISPVFLLIPVISMIVMWYKLDEGAFVLILLTAIAVFFPEVLGRLFSMLL